MFINGNTSVPMMGPLTADSSAIDQIQGVAFSNIDYNLWNGTTHGSRRAWHQHRSRPEPHRSNGYPVAGGESMYFGLQNPAAATPSGRSGGPARCATNYQYQNSQDYYTYNVPGGAAGSLESTTTFSLAGYTSQDCPTLSFTYYLDAGTDDYGRVYHLQRRRTIGRCWIRCPGLNNGGGLEAGGPEPRGLSPAMRPCSCASISARPGDMATGDTYTAGNTSQDQGILGGAYLTALPGDQLKDGNGKAGNYMRSATRTPRI